MLEDPVVVLLDRHHPFIAAPLTLVSAMTVPSKLDLSGISNDLLCMQKVCVQVPQDLLHESQNIISTLTARFSKVSFSIIADSSMSDCCLDFISAAHFDADALIKIGEICYRPSSPPIPYFHVTVLLCTAGLSEQLSNVVDLEECNHLNVISESLSTSNTAICALERVSLDRCQPITWDDTLDLCGATLVVGSPAWKAYMLSLVCPQSHVYQWDETALISLNSNRIRSKRFSVISSLSSKCSIGVLVHSTLKVFADLALRLAATSRSHGHPTYVVSVGRLSPMKLGNFPDIQAWVVVGCNKVLFSKDQYFAPILSTFEFLCLLGLCDFWAEKYETDPERLGAIIERIQQSEISAEPGPIALKVNSDFSSGALLSSAFQGISAEVPEALFENTGEILKGATGLPRSYTPL